MGTSDIGLVARAQGVRTHLLARATLESLSEAADLADFTARLSRLGPSIDSVPEPRDVQAVERAIRRTSKRHLDTLRRWQQRPAGVLEVFAADQDRRNLRALLRGAIQGAPVSERLAGLLPTPHLPSLALSELARQTSPAAIVALLAVLAHPDAPALLPLVQTSQVDPFALEVALLHGFAGRALRASHRDPTLRQFVSTLIDAGNARNALLLAAGRGDTDLAEAFVSPGQWLSVNAFEAAANAVSEEAALARLTTTLAGSPLAPLLPLVTRDASHLDRALVSVSLERLTRAARLEPLGTAALLRAVLMIDAQARDLRALAWGAHLGTPSSLLRKRLMTPQ